MLKCLKTSLMSTYLDELMYKVVSLCDISHCIHIAPNLVQVRYRRDHASSRHLPFFRVLEDLMRDICDGAALLTVVHCYCPDLMKLEGKL